MVTCTKCGSGRWEQLHKCPIDPANDRFKCKDCGHVYLMYDPKETIKVTVDVSAAFDVLDRVSQEAIREHRMGGCMDWRIDRDRLTPSERKLVDLCWNAIDHTEEPEPWWAALREIVGEIGALRDNLTLCTVAGYAGVILTEGMLDSKGRRTYGVYLERSDIESGDSGCVAVVGDDILTDELRYIARLNSEYLSR